MMQGEKKGRFMLMGDIGAGKTTLFNRLFGKNELARKTQMLEFEGSTGIDTPGEYFSHPRLYHTLISMAADIDKLVYVHPANAFECRLPYGLLEVYAGKCIDGIVTKTDLPDADLARAQTLLRQAGVSGQIFFTSSSDSASIEALQRYLLTPVPNPKEPA